MTPLILAVDSGLDGAFVWMRGGEMLYHVLTRDIVDDKALDMDELKACHFVATSSIKHEPRIAYLEEPFNPGMTGRANSAGFAGSCKRFGRLQGWLESWGYEVRSVRPQEWQREVLDLARFEVRTEKACKPRLAEGWKLHAATRRGHKGWSLVRGLQSWFIPKGGFDIGRESVLRTIALTDELQGAIATTKSILSHDTKAASIAYAREHYPGVELVPPRCKNPHDGLADAVCIAAWASKKETP